MPVIYIYIFGWAFCLHCKALKKKFKSTKLSLSNENGISKDLIFSPLPGIVDTENYRKKNPPKAAASTIIFAKWNLNNIKNTNSREFIQEASILVGFFQRLGFFNL